MRSDSKGNLYAAGGSNEKVVRLDTSGKMSQPYSNRLELAAQTIALDSAGNLFVGTSPDGKVYKITPAGQSSMFFDPKTKYIWDLAIDRDGTLYGSRQEIPGRNFRQVTPDGKGSRFSIRVKKRTSGAGYSIPMGNVLPHRAPRARATCP